IHVDAGAEERAVELVVARAAIDLQSVEALEEAERVVARRQDKGVRLHKVAVELRLTRGFRCRRDDESAVVEILDVLQRDAHLLERYLAQTAERRKRIGYAVGEKALRNGELTLTRLIVVRIALAGDVGHVPLLWPTAASLRRIS